MGGGVSRKGHERRGLTGKEEMEGRKKMERKKGRRCGGTCDGKRRRKGRK